jgi:hypothetical protein
MNKARLAHGAADVMSDAVFRGSARVSLSKVPRRLRGSG